MHAIMNCGGKGLREQLLLFYLLLSRPIVPRPQEGCHCRRQQPPPRVAPLPHHPRLEGLQRQRSTQQGVQSKRKRNS
ncbi:hypothetical protein GBA52_003175 [Prunus armeniaca]|nr:hypothetical protein GBA52_003175 [Prunus armeniaca]